jgi:hypothetical protein
MVHHSSLKLVTPVGILRRQVGVPHLVWQDAKDNSEHSHDDDLARIGLHPTNGASGVKAWALSHSDCSD